jgi:hypothetical protein
MNPGCNVSYCDGNQCRNTVPSKNKQATIDLLLEDETGDNQTIVDNILRALKSEAECNELAPENTYTKKITVTCGDISKSATLV